MHDKKSQMILSLKMVSAEKLDLFVPEAVVECVPKNTYSGYP